MVVYNMTFSLADSVNFIKWQNHLQESYVKHALENGFDNFKMMRLVRTPHGDAGQTFVLQLFTDSHETIESFENDFKPKLDHQLFLTFGESCLTFVTVLEYL